MCVKIRFLNYSEQSAIMISKLFLQKEQIITLPVEKLSDTKSNTFSWIRVVEPKKDELEIVAEFLSLDEAEKEDLQSFLEEGDRSHVDKDRFVRVVYSVPIIENKEIFTEEIMLFSKKEVLLTIERKKLRVCEQLYSRAEKQQGKYLFKKNAGFFFSELIDEITARFFHHVNKIESNIDILAGKNKLLTTKQIEEISSANTTLSFFNQATLANIEVLNSLRKMYHASFTTDDRNAFNTIYEDTRHILDALKIQREMIMNIFNIQSIISSNQMNVFMKKLTAIALIIMIPTLISGIYGMNIDVLPLSTGPFSFFFVVGIMALITAILFVVFKHSDWL